MLRGRQGFWPFLAGWAAIAAVMAVILLLVLFMSGSLSH